MDFSAQDLGLTLMGMAISWLVTDRVATKKATDKEKAERHLLFQAHIADLKEQLDNQKKSLDRYQEHAEKAAADALIQERASMVVIASVGDKLTALQSETRQTLSTALSLRHP